MIEQLILQHQSMTVSNKSGLIDEILFCQCKFPKELGIREGSFKGVKMIWCFFYFKSPLGGLTEEYGTQNFIWVLVKDMTSVLVGFRGSST